jgi:cytochrome c556
MKAGRLAVAALVLWGLTVLGVGVAFYRSHRAAHAAADERAVIALPGVTRDSVLAEMRAMLVSVNGVLSASARGDTAALRAAAAASGTAAAAATLGPSLPEQFRTRAARTHALFDSLAAAVAADAPRDTVTARLARLTAGCTSCHVAYRLVAKR